MALPLVHSYTTTIGSASATYSHALRKVPDFVQFTPVTDAASSGTGIAIHLASNPSSAAVALYSSHNGVRTRLTFISWKVVDQASVGAW